MTATEDFASEDGRDEEPECATPLDRKIWEDVVAAASSGEAMSPINVEWYDKTVIAFLSRIYQV